MYCPKCGTDNNENARFCRACGMDISIVPMVLTGQLNEALEKNPKRMARALKKQKEIEESMTWESAMSSFFTGVAFLLIFLGGLFFMRGLFMMWIWFIIPSLGCMGSGLGKMFQLRQKEKQLLQNQNQSQTSLPFFSKTNISQMPSRDTNEFLSAPPSITENTTRHLGAEAPTKVLDRDE